MANDGGKLAVHAQWMVDVLHALTSGDNKVFKSCDLWKHQVDASAGGLDAFMGYAPFAFVGYVEDDGLREGGYDLKEVPEYDILIGVSSEFPGVWMWGDDNNLGVSKIRDLVIKAFDRTRPSDDSVKCDEFYYQEGRLVIDTPKAGAIELAFTTAEMNPVN